MNYYKELLCDNYKEINQEILQHIISILDVPALRSFWNPIPTINFIRATPLMQTWLKEQDLRIQSLAVTVGVGPKCCTAHVDTPPAVYKLNWPVQNTETTWNRWFRELTNDCDVETNHLGGRQYNNMGQLEEIARKQVTRPMLIYAGIPHDVWFEEESKFPRLGLQCKLMKEPVEL